MNEKAHFGEMFVLDEASLVKLQFLSGCWTGLTVVITPQNVWGDTKYALYGCGTELHCDWYVTNFLESLCSAGVCLP